MERNILEFKINKKKYKFIVEDFFDEINDFIKSIDHFIYYYNPIKIYLLIYFKKLVTFFLYSINFIIF